MIEDIKKEINQYRSTIKINGMFGFESGKDFACMEILKILDKYKEPDYKAESLTQMLEEDIKEYKIPSIANIERQDEVTCVYGSSDGAFEEHEYVFKVKYTKQHEVIK